MCVGALSVDVKRLQNISRTYRYNLFPVRRRDFNFLWRLQNAALLFKHNVADDATLKLKATWRFQIIGFNFQKQFSLSDSNKPHCSIWITPICPTFVDSWKSPQFSVLQPHCVRPLDNFYHINFTCRKKFDFKFLLSFSLFQRAPRIQQILSWRDIFLWLWSFLSFFLLFQVCLTVTRDLRKKRPQKMSNLSQHKNVLGNFCFEFFLMSHGEGVLCSFIFQGIELSFEKYFLVKFLAPDRLC